MDAFIEELLANGLEDPDKLTRRAKEALHKQLKQAVHHLDQRINELQDERELLLNAEAQLQCAITLRTNALAAALGPCGLLGESRSKGGGADGCDDQEVEDRGSSVQSPAGPTFSLPLRMRDVPPVSQWTTQWREWALCVNQKEISRLWGTAVEDASILLCQAELYGPGSDAYKDLAAISNHTGEELPGLRQEQVESMAQSLGFSLSQLEYFKKVEKVALSNAMRFAPQCSVALQQLRAWLAACCAEEGAEQALPSSFRFHNAVEGAAAAQGKMVEAFQSLMEHTTGALTFKQMVRASVLTFPLRTSYFLLLRAAVDLHEQGRLQLTAQDKGIRAAAAKPAQEAQAWTSEQQQQQQQGRQEGQLQQQHHQGVQPVQQPGGNALYIHDVALAWEHEKQRLAVQQQQQGQEQQQQVQVRAGIKPGAQGAGAQPRCLPGLRSHPPEPRPDSLAGGDPVVEACLVSLRRLNMDEAPLLRGLGRDTTLAAGAS